jgi:hypothetical protein
VYKYQHQQSTFRGGETGDWISEQRGIAPFYNTVDLASNCNVNIAGSISRRHGFSFVTNAPVTNAYGDFDVLCWGFRKYNIQHTNRSLVRRAMVFGERTADVYNVTEQHKLGEKLCSIVTPFTAEVIQRTHYVSIERGVEDASVKAIVFTNRLIHPKLMVYKNEASVPEDFNFQDVPLYNIPKHDFSNGSKKKSGTELGSGNITIVQKHTQYNVTASNPCFTTAIAQDYNGFIIKLKPLGELRVVRRIDDRNLECVLTRDLGNTEAIAPDDFTLYTGFEPIASNERGWFECSAVFQNRLFFANTFDLPNALIGSTTQFKFDFDLGSLQDDEGLYTLVDTHLVDEIVKMQRGSSLHIFSKNQMFVLSSGANVVTPLTVGTTQISQGGGSDPYTQTPQTIEGGILTLDSNVQKLFYISYDRSSETYLPIDLNVVTPKDMVRQLSGSWSFIVINYGREEGECAFFINSSMQIVRVMLLLDNEKQMACFTHYSFDEHLLPLKLFNVGTNLYCIFRETYQNSHFIARIDTEAYLDYSFRATPDPNAGNRVAVPEGCKIRNQNVYCIDRVNGEILDGHIDNDGMLTANSKGNEVEFGLPYELTILTHELQGSPDTVANTSGYKKTVNWIYLSIKEATKFKIGITGNKGKSLLKTKNVIANRTNVHKPHTDGIYVSDFSGYNDECLMYISQSIPGKFFLKNYTAQLTAHAPFGG